MQRVRKIRGTGLTVAITVLSAITLSVSQIGARPGRVMAEGARLSPRRLTPIGSMGAARAFATAITLASGRVLICGGIGPNYRSLLSAELFNPSNRRFSTLSPMITPRAAHTATLLLSGQVLITGGVACSASGCVQLASAEIYDPSLQQFFAAGNMTTPRARHSATLLNDGRVLLAGGSASDAAATAEIYDPVTGAFTFTATLIAPRFLHAATLLDDGQVLLTGGRSCDGECDENPASATAELYDPGRRQFFAAGKMLNPRMLHSTTLLQDGRVLIVGGRSCLRDCEGDRTLQETEIYDPDSGQFLPAASMAGARAGHDAISLPDGQIFIYGGARCSRRFGCEYLNTGELFDPVAGTFVPSTTGTVAGINSVAALMPNQQVLVAGGRAIGKILGNADIFTFPN